MELLTAITEIIRDLLIFVAVMTALLIALIVIVSKMPDSNPLKRLLVALTYRVGATAGDSDRTDPRHRCPLRFCRPGSAGLVLVDILSGRGPYDARRIPAAESRADRP